MSELGQILRLEYGSSLPSEVRTGSGYPVFGSNGEVGNHDEPLIDGPGIIVGRKGSVGKICWSDRPFWPIDTTYWVKCAVDDIRWIYWLLSYLPLDRLDSSTGIPGLNRNDVYALEVFEPSRIEKSVITKVLDALDTTIRQTEAIIEKLKQVKQGLLHDLLTRGIDANGELRPPQSEAPELYKESALGWIPREWDIRSVDNISDSIVDGPFGSNLKTDHYVSLPGVRVVRLQNIGIGEFDDNERAYISDQKAVALSRNQVISGDVLIAALGDESHPVGRSCCYPNHLPPAVNKADCFRLRPKINFATSDFVMRVLNGTAARRQFSSFEQGVTMQRVNLGNLKRVLIALPPVDEQKLASSKMAALDLTMVESGNMLSKLREQKSGLMDDLLTGRVRVTPLLESAAA